MNPKLCQSCPKRTGSKEPCSAALERVASRLANKQDSDENSFVGCSWAINSERHKYCFWEMANDLDGEPKTDKEICQLLNISQTTLDQCWDSIVKKLQAQKDQAEMKEWFAAIEEHSNLVNRDDTIYTPSELRSVAETSSGNLPAQEEDPNKSDKLLKKLRKTGQPVHRSGVKLDIYFGKKVEKAKKNSPK